MKLSRRFASRKDHHQKGGEFVSAGESAATRIKVPTMERADRARHRAAPLRPSASAGYTPQANVQQTQRVGESSSAADIFSGVTNNG
jgi:hypothetical protein